MRWSLLDALTAQERAAVVARARRRRFARNEVIFHEGDPGDALHLVERGHIAIRAHTPDGDVATLRILCPGDCLGELAIVSPGPRNATAVALDGCETLLLGRDQIDDLRVMYSSLDRLLVDALVAEVRRLSSQLVETMYVPVDTRIWRRLRELDEIYDADDETGNTIPITQDLLAQLAGCTRSTANRTLRSAEAKDVVRASRGRIDVLDREALIRLAR